MFWYMVTLDGEDQQRCLGPFVDRAGAEQQQATILTHFEGNTDQGTIVEDDRPNFPHTLPHQIARETQADGSVLIRWSDGSTTQES